MSADGLGEAAGQAVVVGDRASCQSEQSVTRTAQRSQQTLPRQGEVVQTEPSEDVDRRTGGVVDSSVEAVLSEGARTRAHKVVQDSAAPRTGNCRQNLGCRRRNPGDRDQVTSELRAIGTGVVSGRRIVNLSVRLDTMLRYWLKSQNRGLRWCVGSRVTALRHSGGGNGEDAAHAVGLPSTLVVAEEEQLVFDDWRRQGCRQTAATARSE